MPTNNLALKICQAILVLVCLSACNESGSSTFYAPATGVDGSAKSKLIVVPVGEYPAYCRHEAVFCALVVAEHSPEKPIIHFGWTSEGWHAECYCGGKYWRMGHFEIFSDDEPRLPMTDIEEMTVKQFITKQFYWVMKKND